MKKIISLNLGLVLLLLCSCTELQENKDTRFLLDTVVTLTADCTADTLDGAFALCEEYEALLSRTKADSDVHILNNSDRFVEVSHHTKVIVERAIRYANISNGKFDITIYPASSLWDFNNGGIPSRDEISEALKNVDYQCIEMRDNKINLNGKKIDLGGIAKGYIADRLLDYFKENNVSEGIIDLGGNLIVWGERNYTVGIKKPFSDSVVAATVSLRNKAVVTSGIYERYIKTDDAFYHHILDPKTGYPCETDLYSATIICDDATDADALSTVCVLMGLDAAKEIIENTEGVEAIFIDNRQKLHYTSGISSKDGIFTLK